MILCFSLIFIGDIEKCVLASACAAQFLLECQVPASDISMPFLAATGTSMVLSVNEFARELKTPAVRSIFGEYFQSMTVDEERLQTFAWFAVLVARQHQVSMKMNRALAKKKRYEIIGLGWKRAPQDQESSAVKDILNMTATAKKRRGGSHAEGHHQSSSNQAQGSMEMDASVDDEELAVEKPLQSVEK